MVRKALFFYLFLFLILLSVGSESPEQTTIVIRSSSTETMCKAIDGTEAKTCTRTIYSTVRYAQNSSGDWIDAGRVLRITKNSDDITFHYDGNKGVFNITFEVGVIYNGNYFDMATVKQNNPSILFSFPTEEKVSYKKYSLNISEIPVGLQAGFESITLTYKSHTGFNLSQLVSANKKYNIGSIARLNFQDILDNNNTIRINKTERRIYIENLSIVNNQLWLDPVLELTNETTDILADMYTLTASFENYGFQVKINISQLPSTSTIIDALFCVYWDTQDGTPDTDATINRIKNQTWDESSTCAQLDNDATDNTTTDKVWSTISNGQYGCINVTDQVNADFTDSNDYTSIRFEDTDALVATISNCGDDTNFFGGVAAGPKYGEDRENNRATGNFPFLNITYTESTLPTYSNFQNNGTSSPINSTVNWSIDLADNVGLSEFVFAHNQTGTLTNQTFQSISGTSFAANFTLDITLRKDNNICGQFWFNDTSNSINATNLSCFTVANTIPTLQTDLSFENSSTDHSFNVTAVFSDRDNAPDFVNLTIEVSSGSCTQLSNSSSGDDFTAIYNCSGTALADTDIRINATDASSAMINSSLITTTYPNQQPSVASATINNTPPTTDDDLNCDNGATSDDDGDTVVLFYEWVESDVGQNINQSNLSASLTSIDESWKCQIIPNDGFENGSTVTSASVSIGTAFLSPTINISNATTGTTGTNSTSSSPSNNDTFVNLSVTFNDENSGDLHTAYFCTSDEATASGCTGGAFCNSSINSSASPILSCLFNLTGNTTQSHTFYTFIIDNTSLSSSSFEGSFEINFPPTIPTILTPANDSTVTVNFTLVNYSSTDDNSHTINFTVYNSSDNITWQFLYNSTSAFNWTEITDGVHYLQGYSTDEHGYSLLVNSSITNFTKDATAPTINDLSVSDTTPTTSESVTFTANATDAVTGVTSSSCEFTLRKSDYNGGNGAGNAYNETSNTISGDDISLSLSMSAPGTGTLEWQQVHCTDGGGLTETNSSVDINLTISSPPVSGGSSGGGGSTVADPECLIDDDCFDLGLNWFCINNFCNKLEREDIAYSNLLGYGLSDNNINQLLAYGQGICNWDVACEVAIGESRFNCGTQKVTENGKQVVVPGDCTGLEIRLPKGFLTVVGAIGVTLLVILYVSRIKKKGKK